MKKRVNLAKAVQNKKCLGYCWQMRRNKYEYQNDNDLGLDLDSIDQPMTYNKKMFIENGYYIYIMRGIWGDKDSWGASLRMVKLFVKECHPHLFKLTDEEKRRIEAFEGR